MIEKFHIPNKGGNLNILATTRVITDIGAGTWTKPANLLYIDVIAIGGGGGGGSGRKGLASTNRCGGCGGSHGAMARNRISASLLGASENYYVGEGGIGGAAIALDSTSGNSGTDGGDTYLSSFVIAQGGFGGVGGANGTATTAQAGQGISLQTPPIYPLSIGSGEGRNASNTTGGNYGQNTFYVVGAGKFLPAGNGGGLNTANIETAGGAGGEWNQNNGHLSTPPAGGAAFTNGSSGTDNVWTALGLTGDVYLIGIGDSGSGGGSHYLSGAKGGNGGNGGLYGGAGGGGGASTNTVAGGDSGKGGDGAQGLLIIIEYTTY